MTHLATVYRKGIIMKDNYTELQELEIVRLADKWHIDPSQIRQHLDSIYNSNFDDDLAFVDEILNDEALDYAHDELVV